jgi:hypothetical protein
MERGGKGRYTTASKADYSVAIVDGEVGIETFHG